MFSYGQAYGCGRATFQEDFQVDLTKYKGKAVKYHDKIILPEKDNFLVVAFDRFGKLFYESNIMEYAGRKSLILEVLTERVPAEYIAYLDEMKIPYMFCGKENFEPKLFLEKIKEQYNVETFALCGGAEINAVFMREDLVDEVSLVIGAAVDGTRDALTFVGTEKPSRFPKFFKLEKAEVIGCNGVLLKYSKI